MLFEEDAKYVIRLSYTCKKLHHFIKKNVLEKLVCTYNIYERSISGTNIMTSNNCEYKSQPIGNYIWLTTIKSFDTQLRFVSCHIDDPTFCMNNDRKPYHIEGYFRDHLLTIYCKPGQYRNFMARDNSVYTIFVSIYCHCNYGEIVQIVWHDTYDWSKSYHTQLTWTPGDVWIGQLVTNVRNITYSYEVCIDNGGPVIRTEKIKRHSSVCAPKYHISVWDTEL